MTRSFAQKLVLAGIIVLVAGLLLYFVYMGWQAYLMGPGLVVTDPADYRAYSTSTATITGTARRVRDLSLDGRPIEIDTNGNFSETILLLPGYNIETIVAHDQFGHTATRRLELVYNPPATASSTATSTATSTGQ